MGAHEPDVVAVLGQNAEPFVDQELLSPRGVVNGQDAHGMALGVQQRRAVPQIVVDAAKAVPMAGYKNPYAQAKAFAAFAAAEKVGDLDLLGCFMQKEMEQYVITVASAHELLRTAAKLCDEAREMEKAGDAVKRTPHAADGKILSKTTLVSKPE